MTNKRFIAILVSGLLLISVSVGAQENSARQTPPPTEQKARQKAEEQLREPEEKMQQAQRELRAAERQMRDALRQLARYTQEKLRREIKREVVIFGDHPRLGVILRSEANPELDVIGAEVLGLTPGGPAEEAGVEVGDIIVKFNGKILTTPFIDVEVDEDESAPAARLREAVAELHDGDEVELVVKRGSELKTFIVTARRMGGPLVRVWSGPDHHFDLDLNFDDEAWALRSRHLNRSWLDLELASLNPELGEYFGTSTGVLVLRKPKNPGLPLRAGDVIVKVGDRLATSPSRVLSALCSADPGEKLTLEVVRRKETLHLAVVVPENLPESCESPRPTAAKRDL